MNIQMQSVNFGKKRFLPTEKLQNNFYFTKSTLTERISKKTKNVVLNKPLILDFIKLKFNKILTTLQIKKTPQQCLTENSLEKYALA